MKTTAVAGLYALLSIPLTLQGAPSPSNPDGLPETSVTLIARDYETESPREVLSQPGLAVGEWGRFGFGDSGGWKFRPDPPSGTGHAEDSAGWLADTRYQPDQNALLTVSYMLRVSGVLLDEIARNAEFWAHDQKSIDFKYWNRDANGEGPRNSIHFGWDGRGVRFSHVDGGAGERVYFGPDWRRYADRWVWVCHVIDMRGETPRQRYLATYLKAPGDAEISRAGVRYENGNASPLQAYPGHGFWGFFSPIHGYWDDMRGRDQLAGNLEEMSMSVDRLRVMPGWPDAANGPPF